MPSIKVDPGFIDDRFSQAILLVFKMRPHAFLIGGITLLLAIQILSLGLISLQNKRYFEETFHLGQLFIKILDNEKGNDSVRQILIHRLAL